GGCGQRGPTPPLEAEDRRRGPAAPRRPARRVEEGLRARGPRREPATAGNLAQELPAGFADEPQHDEARLLRLRHSSKPISRASHSSPLESRNCCTRSPSSPKPYF